MYIGCRMLKNMNNPRRRRNTMHFKMCFDSINLTEKVKQTLPALSAPSRAALATQLGGLGNLIHHLLSLGTEDATRQDSSMKAFDARTEQ